MDLRKFKVCKKPQIASFAEGPKIFFADLRFADLICGTPTFEQIADGATTGSFFLRISFSF